MVVLNMEYPYMVSLPDELCQAVVKAIPLEDIARYANDTWALTNLIARAAKLGYEHRDPEPPALRNVQAARFISDNMEHWFKQGDLEDRTRRAEVAMRLLHWLEGLNEYQVSMLLSEPQMAVPDLPRVFERGSTEPDSSVKAVRSLLNGVLFRRASTGSGAWVADPDCGGDGRMYSWHSFNGLAAFCEIRD